MTLYSQNTRKLTFENLGQYLAMPGVGPQTACRAYRWYVFRLWQHALSVVEVTGIGSKALGGRRENACGHGRR